MNWIPRKDTQKTDVLNLQGVILRLAIWTIIVLTITNLYHSLTGIKDDQQVSNLAFTRASDKIEVISLGTSHALAFHFPSLQKSGHSFYDNAGDIITAELKLRKVIDQTPSLQYVLLTMSPGYLSRSGALENSDERLWRQTLAQNAPPQPLDVWSNFSALELWDVFNAKYGVLIFHQVNKHIKDFIVTTIKDRERNARADVLVKRSHVSSLKSRELLDRATVITDKVRGLKAKAKNLIERDKKLTASSHKVIQKADELTAVIETLKNQSNKNLERANKLLAAAHKLRTNQKPDDGRCRINSNPKGMPYEFGIQNGYRRVPLEPRCLSHFAELTVTRHTQNLSTQTLTLEEARIKNLQLIKNMAANLKKLGASLVIVTPPFTREYFETEGLQKVWSQEKPIIKILAQDDNIRYLDCHAFFYETDYMSDNKVFYDDDHLTLEGAKQFSAHLKSTLQQQMNNCSQN